MFGHILLATDMTEGERALEIATSIASRFGARLTVVHVYEPSVFAVAGSALTGVDVIEPCSQSAERDLDRLVWRLRGAGVRASAVLRCGVPWEQIVDVAEEVAADLIVTGSHRRRWLSYALRGSVAEKVLHEANVPVLSIPHRGRGRIESGLLSRRTGGV